MDVGTVNGWQPEAGRAVEGAASADCASAGRCQPLDSNYRGEVAKRYAFDDGQGEIGFISSVSEPFCGDCHRARLSADGTVYTCLFAATRHGAAHAAARRRERRGPRRLAAERLAQSHGSLQRDSRPVARAQARRRREAGARRNVPDGRLMLSHVDSANRPTMVDVGDKAVTTRTALGARRRRVSGGRRRALGRGAAHEERAGVRHGDHRRRHGREAHARADPVLPPACRSRTARSRSSGARGNEVVIECSVRATHKTGVEMEALTGATVAALTIYDMCKALTHGIAIREVVLAGEDGRQARLRQGGRERRRCRDRGHGALFRRVPRARGARRGARSSTQRAHGRRTLRRARAPARVRGLDDALQGRRSTTSSPIGTSRSRRATKCCSSRPSPAADRARARNELQDHRADIDPDDAQARAHAATRPARA